MKNKVIACSAFIILALLWLAFGAAFILRPDLLDLAWNTLRSWPLLFQILIGLLVLPVFLGLWIWQTGWPEWVRLVLVAGLALATLYTFFPGRAAAGSKAAPAKA